ncbi:aminotransferase class V-fold PLP-dependent enzyme [Streptomyces sp. NPDC090445]|uniref:aminotransferase class V-fold PLP-dependent enzyme n=1 Tax=Streptomyces sp. NPDC090445 TaxID=3365963 RepID=UPI00380B8E95
MQVAAGEGDRAGREFRGRAVRGTAGVEGAAGQGHRLPGGVRRALLRRRGAAGGDVRTAAGAGDDDALGGQQGDRPGDTAARFEEWEFPYATVLGCAAAVRYALRVGMEPVSRRTPALAARLRGQLAGLPGVRTLDGGAAPAALVTFAVEGWRPQPFKAAMDARGINSALSFREFAQFDFGDKEVEWCLRLSPHYYNTEDEVDEVAAAVAELVRNPR